MSVYGTPDLPEQGQKREVLFVDRKGNPLIVREPRPVGFRPIASTPPAKPIQPESQP